MSGKICKRCEEDKPICNFSRNKVKKDGYDIYCKSCVRQYKQNYYAKYGDRIKESRKAQYKEDALLQETIKMRAKEWSKVNKERRKTIAADWKKRNKAAVVASTQNRNARKRINGGSFTLKEWKSLKESYNNRCLCCRKQEPDIKLTVDHVIPVSMGGQNTIANIQPLCGSCNSAKHNKHIDYRQEW